MNPPSALYGAMNKERKPFTYTPGGLDLSEIKSERMAKRLMRNAMSEGVSETPAQSIKSPPIIPGHIPNFNCLPVQVFPTFQLPANPKSLLKTRSIPDALKDTQSSIVSPASILSTTNNGNDSWREINKPSSEISNNNISYNYKPATMYDYKKTNSNPTTIQPSYGTCSHTELLLPEKRYDAEYFQSEPQKTLKEIEIKSTGSEEKAPQYECSQAYNSDVFLKNATDNETNPVSSISIQCTSTPLQDVATNNNEQKQVKIVKKQTNTENESDQNGDTEAAVIIKLPTKSSAAKTETKVEVLKKVLPDGTIEEVKKTITKTTKDGRTEISTKTETRTIPKEIAEDEVGVEEVEDEIENVIEVNDNTENVVETSKEDVESNVTQSIENGDEVEEESEDEVENTKTEVKENGHIITGEEKLESSTTKKVVIIQSTGEESEEEIEEEVEEEEQEEGGDVDVEEVVIIKKTPNTQNEANENTEDPVEVEASVEISKTVEPVEQDNEIEEEEEEIVEEEEEIIEEEEKEIIEKSVSSEEEETVEKEHIEKSVSNEEEETVKKETEVSKNEQDSEEKPQQKEIDDISAQDDSPKNEIKENVEEGEAFETNVEVEENTPITPLEENTEIELNVELKAEEEKESKINESDVPQEPVAVTITTKVENKNSEINNEIHHQPISSEPRVSFREPSIPFEKVEDIEIKPIGPAQEIIKKSHTEIITTTTDQPAGALSTQTEYNRIENVVTVNRTTKTLDHAYEQTQQTIPTLKTYFAPINDRVLATPQPISKPYQPIYTPEPQPERRHSLLLDRLSVDRQIPSSDIYQNNYHSNQGYEQNQWIEEPQSEVLTVSNVKPSTITKNQQWYQQTMKENVISNTVSPTPVLPSQIWNQQNQAPSQNQIPTKPQYQTFTQQQYTPKSEFQSTYVDNNAQNIYKSNTNNAQPNIYPSYTPKPSWVSSTLDSKSVPSTAPNLYSLKKESTESYQKSTQQFNSSYVPPPWEQDSSYIPDQSYYQPPPSTVSYTPNINQTNQTWTPKPPPGKFTKPTPTAYIPPAPNQSFVKPVSMDDASKVSGRKTYYSEYERRYISVPESTYIPNETKLSAQPDPSPQYYYDNNEPAEFVEPQWRKELREFTEKASQTTTQTENTSIRPPWEEDPKYVASNEYSATVTPSWTQTLRPRSWRERSYEPEYMGSKEWPKTNTLGRGRPQSSYVKSNVNTIQERPRGVSVDRYNPNNYQSPLTSEHPPVQSYTLNPTIHPKTYHNPTVPAYHARASAEPREQTTAYPKQRMRVDTRAPPVQSRSFKYLQWITGTED